MATTASFTFEAKRLAHQNLGTLRPLVERAGGKSELLRRVGDLCAGKHPASALLERARNSFGFHWDYEDEYVGNIVRSFARNETIVWVEEVPPPQMDTVHRLATEVLAHGLLPETASEPDPAQARKVTDEAIRQLLDAMGIIAEFFTVAVVRYLIESKCRMRTAGETSSM